MEVPPESQHRLRSITEMSVCVGGGVAPKLGKLWVANAASDGRGAWTRPYREFDLKEIWGE